MSELHEYKQKFQNKVIIYDTHFDVKLTENTQVDEVKEQCDNTINKLTIENIELR